MRVKGTIIKTVDLYVKNKHPDRYDQWMNKLPEESKKIFRNSILATDWYPVEEALLIPTKIACELFFDNPQKGAWELGRYSAHTGLTGIYKVFVLIATPSFLISRAGKIITMMYENSEMSITENDKKSGVVTISKLPINDLIIENRAGGWIEGALEVCGCKNIQSKITKQLSRGDHVTEYRFSWD